MTLSNLIRKGGLTQVATATPATNATQETANTSPVALVATVAVARSQVLSAEEEASVRAWLAHIEETDTKIIGEVIDQCNADIEARAYFLRRAEEVPQLSQDDDRRRCAQCANLATNGQCLAARRGEISASRIYYPVVQLPRRCDGYAPGSDDPDRRTGSERWRNSKVFDDKGGSDGR